MREHVLRVASVVLVLSAAVTRAQQPQRGEPAPPFSLDAWLNVEKGKEPTLESLRGRVVMIEFWGTWCGPCVRSMPEVQKDARSIPRTRAHGARDLVRDP